MNHADVVVVGGGAAGLWAATIAARRGRRVLVLEKNLRPGLKILVSGGGRCNLTTTRTGQDLERQYGERRGRWLRAALRAFPPAALRQEIEAAGVPLHEEDLEKLFPISRRASDVLDALLRLARAAGVELRPAAPMLACERTDAGFVVHTPQAAVTAPHLVLACGGLSYPKTGTTGDGYPVARQFGHTIVPTVPALAPLALEPAWVRELAGIVVDAELSLRDAGGRVVNRRRRPTLFTHRGLSGPAPMDLAGDVEERGGGELQLDFVPEWTAERCDQSLQEAARSDGRRAVQHVLPGALPERLRETLVRLAATEPVVAELRRASRRRLVLQLKATTLRVERSLGFAHAEVTRGGVALDEVDPRTMQSRRVPGLFVCGELLDVDGPIGGFNFQAAFATGWCAGQAV